MGQEAPGYIILAAIVAIAGLLVYWWIRRSAARELSREIMAKERHNDDMASAYVSAGGDERQTRSMYVSRRLSAHRRAALSRAISGAVSVLVMIWVIYVLVNGTQTLASLFSR